MAKNGVKKSCRGSQHPPLLLGQIRHTKKHLQCSFPLKKKHQSSCSIPLVYLVGGFIPSEKYEFVNWDDCSPFYWENKSHVPVTTNQSSYMPAGIIISRFSINASQMFAVQVVHGSSLHHWSGWDHWSSRGTPGTIFFAPCHAMP